MPPSGMSASHVCAAPHPLIAGGSAHPGRCALCTQGTHKLRGLDKARPGCGGPERRGAHCRVDARACREWRAAARAALPAGAAVCESWCTERAVAHVLNCITCSAHTCLPCAHALQAPHMDYFLEETSLANGGQVRSRRLRAHPTTSAAACPRARALVTCIPHNAPL